tara:strand:+ start:641 stop:805 length:165 start_codon:yes stop_codon:yes gene_type:complete
MDITVRGTGATVSERNSLITISYQLLISLAGPLVLFVELLPQMTQGTGFFMEKL